MASAPSCVEQLLAAIDPVLQRADRRYERYSLTTMTGASDSSWAAHFWAKGVYIGLRVLRESLCEAAPDDLDTPRKLAKFLRRFKYPRFIREDLSTCADGALLTYKAALVRWVRSGMPEGKQPNLD